MKIALTTSALYNPLHSVFRIRSLRYALPNTSPKHTRHLMMLLRLMQLRQQYAEASSANGEQALFDALLRGIDGE